MHLHRQRLGYEWTPAEGMSASRLGTSLETSLITVGNSMLNLAEFLVPVGVQQG